MKHEYSLNGWIKYIEENNIDFAEYALDFNEKFLGSDRKETIKTMYDTLEVMQQSINTGLSGIKSPSGLSGGVSKSISESQVTSVMGIRMRQAAMRAIAVGEANASMGKIVAAPTAGASGVLPAVIFTLKEDFKLSDDQLAKGLIVAGGIGLIIAKRACIAGAIGGCQAECGSAAAMAAGMTVYLLNGTPTQMGTAVAIALKNLMGLVCDPVAGLVEAPCIKRNAGATIQAMLAAELALMNVSSTIPADEVIDAMKNVGDSLPTTLKETALGGLAMTPTAQDIHKRIFG